MIEREKLIELLDGADLFLRNRADSSPAPLNEFDIEALHDIANICDEAARMLEKAIVPPCKVGSKIYMLVTKRAKVTSAPFTFIKTTKVTYYNLERVMQDFGKTVFLTREEAEAKLKEVDND